MKHTAEDIADAAMCLYDAWIMQEVEQRTPPDMAAFFDYQGSPGVRSECYRLAPALLDLWYGLESKTSQHWPFDYGFTPQVLALTTATLDAWTLPSVERFLAEAPQLYMGAPLVNQEQAQ